MSSSRSTRMEVKTAFLTLLRKRLLGRREQQVDTTSRILGRFTPSRSMRGLLRTKRATCVAVKADLHAHAASLAVAPSAGVGAPTHPV